MKFFPAVQRRQGTHKLETAMLLVYSHHLMVGIRGGGGGGGGGGGSSLVVYPLTYIIK